MVPRVRAIVNVRDDEDDGTDLDPLVVTYNADVVDPVTVKLPPTEAAPLALSEATLVAPKDPGPVVTIWLESASNFASHATLPAALR